MIVNEIVKDLEKELNRQLNMELAAAYQYEAMAAHFQYIGPMALQNG